MIHRVSAQWTSDSEVRSDQRSWLLTCSRWRFPPNATKGATGEAGAPGLAGARVGTGVAAGMAAGVEEGVTTGGGKTATGLGVDVGGGSVLTGVAGGVIKVGMNVATGAT